MSCDNIRTHFHAYLDSELDVLRSLEFEEHLKGCSSCSGAHQEYQSLRAAIAGPSLHFEVPRGLERKVRSAVTEAARAETSRPAWRWTWNWKWPAWLAPFAAAALVTVVTLHFFTEDQSVQEILSAHVRSLMVDHLTDVASSDQHTVKPWFTGKLNFSPTVIDPAAEGFPLIGGRLDYVADSPAAAVVYQRRKHYINLFVSPANKTPTTKADLHTRHGYNLIHWLQGGMEYWAVSDVNKTDLQQFVQLVRGEAPAGSVR